MVSAKVTQLSYISGDYVCPVCNCELTTTWLTKNVFMFGCYNTHCPVNPMVFGDTPEKTKDKWECLSTDLRLLKEYYEKKEETK